MRVSRLTLAHLSGLILVVPEAVYRDGGGEYCLPHGMGHPPASDCCSGSSCSAFPSSSSLSASSTTILLPSAPLFLLSLPQMYQRCLGPRGDPAGFLSIGPVAGHPPPPTYILSGLLLEFISITGHTRASGREEQPIPSMQEWGPFQALHRTSEGPS